MRYSRQFYLSEDIHEICKSLLGSQLCVRSPEGYRSGSIVEVEAYVAPEDPASHAFARRRTSRNETMYAQGGTCYMYLCYGIHQMCNIVTNARNIPHAVLIRAIEPLQGLDIMRDRRKGLHNNRLLTGGPGWLTQTLGLDAQHNGVDLVSSENLYLTRGQNISEDRIVQTSRIGISKGDNLPYRYYIKDNKWVSVY